MSRAATPWSNRFGSGSSRVDILVNNAGADFLTGPAAHWPFQRKLAALWELDVAATIQLSRQLGGQMLDQPAAE